MSIQENVLRSAKRRARELGLTLGQLIERSFRRELERPRKPTERPVIPVFHGKGGLRPGIDPRSNRSLLEALDEGLPIDRNSVSPT